MPRPTEKNNNQPRRPDVGLKPTLESNKQTTATKIKKRPAELFPSGNRAKEFSSSDDAQTRETGGGSTDLQQTSKLPVGNHLTAMPPLIVRDFIQSFGAETQIEFLVNGAWRDRPRQFLQQVQTSLNDSDRYPLISTQYLSRLLAAAFLFVLSGYINAVSSASAGWRTPNLQLLHYPSGDVMKGSYALPDLGHDLVAWIGTTILPTSWTKDGGVNWPEGPDFFVGIHVILAVLLLTVSPQRLKIVRRLLVIYSVLNMLRAFTVIATSLPDPFPKCHEQFTNPATGGYKLKPMFPNNLFRGFKAMQGHTTCGDCIFSGHSVLMLLASRMYTEYFYKLRLGRRIQWLPACFVRTVVQFVAAFGVMTVLATRFHYTLDVAIAVFLTLRVWDSYHLYTRTLVLRRGSRNPFMQLLLWFEAELIISLEKQHDDNIEKFEKELYGERGSDTTKKYQPNKHEVKEATVKSQDSLNVSNDNKLSWWRAANLVDVEWDDSDAPMTPHVGISEESAVDSSPHSSKLSPLHEKKMQRQPTATSFEMERQHDCTQTLRRRQN